MNSVPSSSPSISPLVLARGQVRLRKRDLAIIQMLDRVRLAKRSHIQEALGFSSPRSAQQALKRLSKEPAAVTPWLQPLGRQVGGSEPGQRGGFGSTEQVYTLASAGIALARAMAPNSGRSSKPWSLPAAFIEHALMTTAVYVELAKLEAVGVLKIRAFETEPACWRPMPSGAKLKPDGFVQVAFELPRADGSRRRTRATYFLEADRDTERQPELRRKLRAYVRYVQSREWATGQDQLTVPPRVLILVPGPERVAELERLIAELPEGTRRLFEVALQGEAGIRLTAAGAGEAPPTDAAVAPTRPLPGTTR